MLHLGMPKDKHGGHHGLLRLQLSTVPVSAPALPVEMLPVQTLELTEPEPKRRKQRKEVVPHAAGQASQASFKGLLVDVSRMALMSTAGYYASGDLGAQVGFLSACAYALLQA